MLVRLTKEQVTEYWDLLALVVGQAISGTVEDIEEGVNNVLNASLSGKLDVYVYLRDGTPRYALFVQYLEEDILKQRNLLIFIMGTVYQTQKGDWNDGLEQLKKIAKNKGCSRIVAYTNKEPVLKLTHMLGWENSIHFVSYNINEEV